MQFKNSFNLFKQLSVREITSTVRNSNLGILWLLFAPLLSLSIYFVVFGVLFGGSFSQQRPESSFQYAIGVYIGLSIVMFVSESISRSPSLIKANENLVKRVIFPLELLPVVQSSGVGFKFFSNFLLWFAMGAFFAESLSFQSIYLILILLPLPILVLGLTFGISALSVYMPDIEHVTPPVTQIIFWSSGVFYGAEKVASVPMLWNIIKWNPVFQINEMTRNIILWGQPPSLLILAYVFTVSTLILVIGLALFKKLKQNFSDFI